MSRVKEINLRPLIYFLLGAVVLDILTTNNLSYQNAKYLAVGLLIVHFWRI